ncbi:SEC28 (YIL076W) [Zygosaccharomyces parabailii]|uniref:Coatomer subunit epsilon n=1 Tax=Zygosaccharomyces bailii (strain CLIB 213 / ATCC 58445 / CBS 680 / BCRC 21525 / NBRC 1098 / NCYC 1416 / NRRL Y-2227) TaxID=1333698 RepID=A0A8J2T7C4_ZYGB2|nr:SEC28 (YIL076W) [Zygosaccharomyces parabailii]AQZ14517.1 SEC28 (YIL076W) [Zygosaccharomyces parabailii]CDF89361.1 ZYBA0S04-02432g1_1 [Zygosaccharomyces bailii CLIB 213]CDH08322.1 related to Coatomer subunit epsilon [Zygosaccharomyces bailii ISA1307]SJM85744.1 related to Coatomer subunit epsilon [Zygosaccharomyces bailii]
MNYFTIKQNYYAGDFLQVLQEIGKFNKVSDDTLVFYKSQSQLETRQFEAQDNSALEKAFTVYHEFLKNKEIGPVREQIPKESSSPFELYLLGSAEAMLGQFEDALMTCVQGIDSDESVGTPELLLLAVQVALLNGQASTAQTMLENYSAANEDTISSDDEIIISLSESYVKFSTNQETTRSNFYYFEELSQTFPTWKTQLGLLNLHVQQGNLPEAQSLVNTLESDYYSVEQKQVAHLYKQHFMTSKIPLLIAQGDKEVQQLREKLKQEAPENSYVKSNREANAKFDEVVAKYSS